MKPRERLLNESECPDGETSTRKNTAQIVPKDGVRTGPFLKFSRKQKILSIVLFMLVLIFVTRLPALRHGLKLHPDELVFFSSASSLFFGSPYHVYKIYPEGAFLMQMPFQMIRQFILLLLRYGVGAQLYGAHMTGRLASVLYFSLGAVLGCTFLSLIQKKTLPIALYAAAIVFSLFQIEQSRYATGEAPSFFLLMAMLNLLALSFRLKKTSLLYAAAFVAGALGAVKYPQFYFILLPIGAACLNRRSSKTPLVYQLLLILLCSFAGLICLSPSILKPGFLSQIISRETDAYITNPNIVSTGTPFDHLLSLLLYHLLYADVPFAPVFAIVGLIALTRQSEQTNARTFFTVFVPFVFVGFFLYNLFIPTLYFRTYYLYFCFFLLYAAIGLAELLTRKHIKQLVLALLCVMVLRGGFLTLLLWQPQKDAGAPLYAHEKWSNQATVTVAGTGFVNGDIPNQATQINMKEAFVTIEPRLEAGEFYLLGGYQYGIARSRIFDITNAAVLSVTDGWNSFRAKNEPYLFAQLYPDFYYQLFGFWLEGSMGTLYEFPSVYYYYKPSAN